MSTRERFNSRQSRCALDASIAVVRHPGSLVKGRCSADAERRSEVAPARAVGGVAETMIGGRKLRKLAIVLRRRRRRRAHIGRDSMTRVLSARRRADGSVAGKEARPGLASNGAIRPKDPNDPPVLRRKRQLTFEVAVV